MYQTYLKFTSLEVKETALDLDIVMERNATMTSALSLTMSATRPVQVPFAY